MSAAEKHPHIGCCGFMIVCTTLLLLLKRIQEHFHQSYLQSLITENKIDDLFTALFAVIMLKPP
jgi:hypothetical protein